MNYWFFTLVIGMFFSACSFPGLTPKLAITDFESCVVAGNPIQESYPPKCSANGQTFTQDIGNELEMADVIRVDNPRPHQTISSPLTMSGQARGTYFFEASFPVRLETEAGMVIAQTSAQTQGEWMTQEYVPFSASLTFTPPDGFKGGVLVLEKDNPSGLPQQAAALRIPVRF